MAKSFSCVVDIRTDLVLRAIAILLLGFVRGRTAITTLSCTPTIHVLFVVVVVVAVVVMSFGISRLLLVLL
jgi:hypothetical protein